MSRTWIVIPNRDGLRFLPECLGSVAEHSPNAAVCFVDNASTDGSVEYVGRHHPNVRVIELEMNLGFVQATNLGLLAGLKAGADAFVLLNNDTRVSPEWLESLEAASAIEPELGIVGSWQDDFAGHASPRTKAILAAAGLDYCDQSFLPRLVDADWVEGSCMWIRREVIDAVGFLDPLFAPAYFEEVDFCRRARRAGWRVAMSTTSVIEHFGAGSSQSTPARRRQRILSERNYLIYHAADPACNSPKSMGTLLAKAVRRGLKAWRRRELSLSEWAAAVAGLPSRVPGIAAKNARDRRNRPCPVLGDRSLSTLEQRYYADRVAEMELMTARPH